MGGGGKTSKQETKIDKRLEAASRNALDSSAAVNSIPYLANRGVQFAAFNPTQEAAFQGTNSLASAFGMGTSSGSGLPAATDAGNGIMGYGVGDIYDATKNASITPAMQNSIDLLFADPETGQLSPNASPLYRKLYGDGKGMGGGAGGQSGGKAGSSLTGGTSGGKGSGEEPRKRSSD